MNRKLLILDAVLGVGVIFGGFEFHSEWAAAKARQARMPGPAPKAALVTPPRPLPQQPAVMPSGYKNIAMNTLFDPSRNPNVPVDPPPAPPPPPPPKEPPPLPVYHGLMDFGDPQGPVALLTPDGEQGHKQVHAGEMIGEFKLIAFDHTEMTLDWEGKTIHKRLGETSDSGKPRAANGGPAFGPNAGILPGISAPQQPQAPQPPVQTEPLGPGQQVTDGIRSCQANDSTPAGSVNDGYRKEIHMTPLGAAQCIWVSVGK